MSSSSRRFLCRYWEFLGSVAHTPSIAVDFRSTDTPKSAPWRTDTGRAPGSLGDDVDDARNKPRDAGRDTAANPTEPARLLAAHDSEATTAPLKL